MLNFYNTVYPFGEIAIIFPLNGNSLLTNINMPVENGGGLNNYIYKFRNIEYNILTSLNIQKDKKDTEYIFSGITRDDKKLLIGQNDVRDYIDDINNLLDYIGEYTLFIQDQNNIRFFSDYFGVSKIYYYINNDYYIIANNYHLLIILLKNLNIKLTLNENKVKANLVSLTGLPNWTNFSFSMEVNGIKELPSDQYIEITSDSKLNIKNTSLYDEIRNPVAFDKKKYKKQLYLARDEIIDNCKCCFTNDNYEYVQVDLSGGLDSRITYAACTNLSKKLQKKIRIRSHIWPPEDLPVAMTVNNIYKFLYNDLEAITNLEYTSKMIDMFQSQFMGTYFMTKHFEETEQYNNVIRIGGAFGEMFYARLPLIYPAKDKEHLINLLFKIPETSSLLINEKKYFRICIEEYLDHKPGISFEDAWINHYLFFLPQHFTCKYTFSSIVNTFPVLLSKNLFKLRQINFARNRDKTNYFDLLYVLNPLLSSIPYSGKQNKEKKDIKEKLYKKGKYWKKIKLNNNQIEWEKAKKRFENNQIFYPDKKTCQESIKNEREKLMNKEYLNTTFENIVRLTNIFNEEEIQIIFNRINKFEEMGPFSQKNLTFKLLSLKNQAELIRNT